MMQRIQNTPWLSIEGLSAWSDGQDLDVLRQTVKALVRASRSLEYLTTLVGVSAPFLLKYWALLRCLCVLCTDLAGLLRPLTQLRDACSACPMTFI